MSNIVILVKDEEAAKMAYTSSKLRHYRMFKRADNIFYKIDPEAGLAGWEVDKMMSDEIYQIQKVMRYEPTSGLKALVDSLHCGGRQQANFTARAQNQNVVRAWIQGHGRRYRTADKYAKFSSSRFDCHRRF